MKLLDILLLHPIGWLLNKAHPFPVDEYCQRFVYPQIVRAKAKGIPDETIQAMWSKAWDAADPWIIGRAPAALFRDMIDTWEDTP